MGTSIAWWFDDVSAEYWALWERVGEGEGYDNQLQWLHYELASDALDFVRGAAISELRHRRPDGPYFCSSAAHAGKLHWLQWARAESPPWPWGVYTLAAAAGRGDIEMLRWMRAQTPPCPWNESAAAWAANHGELEALQWLLAQDPPCPCDGDVVRRARTNHHAEAEEWALANGCPWNESAETW